MPNDTTSRAAILAAAVNAIFAKPTKRVLTHAEAVNVLAQIDGRRNDNVVPGPNASTPTQGSDEHASVLSGLDVSVVALAAAQRVKSSIDDYHVLASAIAADQAAGLNTQHAEMNLERVAKAFRTFVRQWLSEADPGASLCIYTQTKFATDDGLTIVCRRTAGRSREHYFRLRQEKGDQTNSEKTHAVRLLRTLERGHERDGYSVFSNVGQDTDDESGIPSSHLAMPNDGNSATCLLVSATSHGGGGWMSGYDSHHHVECSLIERAPWMDAMASILSIGPQTFLEA